MFSNSGKIVIKVDGRVTFCVDIYFCLDSVLPLVCHLVLYDRVGVVTPEVEEPSQGVFPIIDRHLMHLFPLFLLFLNVISQSVESNFSLEFCYCLPGSEILR